jgi:NAD(P)-dependent dehydrogenase (short-subunit alcohol dehydrogenase family)
MPPWREKPFETITDADWDRRWRQSARAFIVAQETARDAGRKWGRINITSIGGQWGGSPVHYAAAKAG